MEHFEKYPVSEYLSGRIKEITLEQYCASVCTHGTEIIINNIKGKLSGIIPNKLLEHKIISSINRSNSIGLNFANNYSADFFKLCRLFCISLLKESPYIEQLSFINTSLKSRYPTNSFRFKVIYKKSIKRYIRRLNTFLANKLIPIGFIITTTNSSINLLVESDYNHYLGEPAFITVNSITGNCPFRSNPEYSDKNIFGIAFFIPQIKQILYTLHRASIEY